MNILIVGAGAVGLVYGHHFTQAGHQVTFLVKDKYQLELEQEDTILYYLNKDQSLQKPIRFKQFSVITRWEDVSGFDLIALTISSNALRNLPLELIKEKMASRTSLLMLQPSHEDYLHLSKSIASDRILQGMITLISYHTDDINHNISLPGTAYYLPPLPMPLSTSQSAENSTAQSTAEEALADALDLFNHSSIKARRVDSAIDESRLMSAFFMTLLCVLEAANWEFDRLNNSPLLLQHLSKAQKELLPHKIAGTGFPLKIKQALVVFILKPWFYKSLIWLSPKVLPLPIEAYLKKHFLKVRPQTVMYLQDYYSQLPSKALADLIFLIGEQTASPEH